MLVPAAIIGILTIIYGGITMPFDTLARDKCDPKYNFTMCPLCDPCDFWSLNRVCTFAKVTSLIDNDFTVFYSLFMTAWGVLYLRLWERYIYTIAQDWGLLKFDFDTDEYVRPDYIARTKGKKISFWTHKFPAYFLSSTFSILVVRFYF